MPEVVSVALGGGTLIEQRGDEVIVGPESVGHRLTSEALVFGGKTMTATGKPLHDSLIVIQVLVDHKTTNSLCFIDIVVAAGSSVIGDADQARKVPSEIVSKARAGMKKILENAIDSMKLSADPAIVVIVGGGSIVNIDQLDGVCELIRPK
jgi:N-methylhydantoinase A/oxoprolinase/acetone carboxylase beta subunit